MTRDKAKEHLVGEMDRVACGDSNVRFATFGVPITVDGKNTSQTVTLLAFNTDRLGEVIDALEPVFGQIETEWLT
jgi:hypothetical protein